MDELTRLMFAKNSLYVGLVPPLYELKYAENVTLGSSFGTENSSSDE